MIQKATFLKVAAALAAGLLLLGCKPEPKVIELSVSDKTVAFETAGGDKTVTVTCNDAWTASCNANWVTLAPKSGEGNGSIKITATANDSFDVRSADVIVTAGDKSQTIKVNQLAPTPSLILDKETLEAEAAGGEFTVTVTSNAPWTITIPAEAAWVTADKASGNGNGSVKFTVAATDVFEAREAQVKFTFEGQTKTLKVQQAALVPSLTISKESFQAPAEGGTAEVDVEANVTWTVVIPEGCEWITADKASGTGNDKVTFTVAENIYRATRTATVVFQGDQSQQKEIVFSQEMAALSRRTDSLALVKIYTIADGANWKESRRWDLEKPMTDWPGIKLNNEGRVIELSITNGTVSTVDWELPADLTDLTELSVFQAVGSRVVGVFPEFLYDMTKLTKLVINGNKITGSFSDKVANWTELTNLYINNNKEFGGTLPAAFSSLKNLLNLNVAQTAIGGAVPAELSACTSLQNFMAYEAQFTSIPDNWDQWPALKIVQIYGNKGLECPLPASLGNAKNVTSLQMHNCNFTGNIPESYANLPATCKQLYINGNRLKGVVPAVIQAHANWASVWKVSERILPQQDGFGLTLKEGSGGQDLDSDVNADPWN